MKFSEYVKEHTRLWNMAQNFDSKFNVTILSKLNFRFKYKVCCLPNICIITVENNNYNIEERWSIISDLKFLPANILCEYAQINQKVQEWREEKIDFPF